MSSSTEPTKVPAGPAGEEIHLPGPTPIPLITGIATTMVVVGSTNSLIIAGAGVLLLGWCLVRWIRESRESFTELPEAADAPGDDS